MITLPKTSRFYIGMSLIMLALAILVVFVLRGIFSAISLAGEIDESLLSSQTPRLDRVKVESALDSVRNREFTPLDL